MTENNLTQTYYGLSEDSYKKVLRDILNNKDESTSLVSPLNACGKTEKLTSVLKLSTGIPELDSLTKGGLKKGVHVIAGFRKCCKSTLAINLIYRALNEGLNVCLLSLEMSKSDVLNILISLHTFEQDSKTAKTRDEIEELYVNNIEKYNEYLYSLLALPGNLVIFTEDDIKNNCKHNPTPMYSESNLTDLFNQANKDCYKASGKAVEVLVVDNINCIRVWDKKTVGETAYSHASNFFRQSANNFGNRDKNKLYGNEPVICLLVSQINRTGGKAAEYDGFYPDSCIAETVNIERDATTVIPVYTNAWLISSNVAFIKLEASRCCKAMDSPLEIPINLPFGKIGLPISKVNIDNEKLKQLKLMNKLRLVKQRDDKGKVRYIGILKNEPLPDGYIEYDDYFRDEDDDWFE